MEWVVISFRVSTQGLNSLISSVTGRCLIIWATRKSLSGKKMSKSFSPPPSPSSPIPSHHIISHIPYTQPYCQELRENLKTASLTYIPFLSIFSVKPRPLERRHYFSQMGWNLKRWEFVLDIGVLTNHINDSELQAITISLNEYIILSYMWKLLISSQNIGSKTSGSEDEKESQWTEWFSKLLCWVFSSHSWAESSNVVSTQSRLSLTKWVAVLMTISQTAPKEWSSIIQITASFPLGKWNRQKWNSHLTAVPFIST